MKREATTAPGVARLLGAVVALLGLVAVQLSGVAGAARTTARAGPSCPSSAAYGHYPHPNCLLKPWIVTRDPSNDLGVAGFEAAIVVTVPKYTGAPPKCLALGKC